MQIRTTRPKTMVICPCYNVFAVFIEPSCIFFFSCPQQLSKFLQILCACNLYVRKRRWNNMALSKHRDRRKEVLIFIVCTCNTENKTYFLVTFRHYVWGQKVSRPTAISYQTFSCACFSDKTWSRQLATNSENLVASTQFLVALATSKSQFRALLFLQQALAWTYPSTLFQYHLQYARPY